ncbi:hypothetical protein [Thermobrachium celere]|uniref:DUF8052 domain-containing protein n=1 Tax=Thermobrachium celere DSM 8682 TaxID=941824 RepID=R7RNC2_9CLOT|nr:hypothetical protein [Thermobrachium celere]CDF57682.1 hypothetical protein TCEL_01596 [Thermobrachium celere DSM 8682]
MNKNEYIKMLAQKFEKYFDIEFDKNILNLKLDLFAKHYSLNGRTFLTKKDVIDEFENYEYVFLKHYNYIDVHAINEFIDFLKKVSEEVVNPTKNHMSTYINGVVLFDSIDEGVKDVIKRFKNSKTFLFGLRGWFDTRLLAVDLNGQDIICNREGKRVKKVYQITP